MKTRDSPSGTPRTILVVDDNADTRSFMKAALEAEGYKVLTATEGEQAVSIQRGDSADLLITDIFMPGQEGMETIAIFKDQFPETRIIAMSAGGSASMKLDPLAMASLHEVGATLRKPFDTDQLLATVHRVLQSR